MVSLLWMLLTIITSPVIAQQSYGPVDLDAVDPLSLSWNQIHWLVKDQIKEVEDLKAEPRPSPGGPELQRAEQTEGGAGVDEAEPAPSDEGETRAAPCGGGAETAGDRETGGGTEQTAGTRNYQLSPVIIIILILLIIILVLILLVLLILVRLQLWLDVLLLELLPQEREQQCSR